MFWAELELNIQLLKFNLYLIKFWIESRIKKFDSFIKLEDTFKSFTLSSKKYYIFINK